MTLGTPAPLRLSLFNMSTKAKESPGDENNRPRPTHFAGLQPLRSGCHRLKQSRLVRDVHSVSGKQIAIGNNKIIGNNSKVSKCSSLASTILAEKETGTQDIEMLDATDATSASLNNGLNRRSTSKTAFTPKDPPIVYVDRDGDVVEIISSTSSNADYFGVSNTNQTHKLWSTSSNMVRLRAPGNSALEAPSTLQYRPSRPQSFRTIDQDKRKFSAYMSSAEEPDIQMVDAVITKPYTSRAQPHRKADQGPITAYLCPESSGQEQDVQILNTAIARNFPVYRNSKIGPGDYLDDAAFDQWMKVNSPRSLQEINEEDEAAVEDFAEEDFIVSHLRELVISSSTGPSSSPVRKTTWQQRNSNLDTLKNRVLDLRKDVTVELHNGSFLWIQSVQRNFWGPITIRGYRLARDGYCGSRLPDGRLNELVWINEINEEGRRAGLESALHEEQITDVKRVREVIYTNCPWPEFSCYGEAQRALNGNMIDDAKTRENGRLCCRWKYVQVNSRLRTDAEACLSLLSEEEAVGIGALEASVVQREWQGYKGKIPGGSSKKAVFNVETGKTTFLQQYNLGDCFCGAGGISRGATQAGLQVAWGFDEDAPAIGAHAENFAKYGTKSLELNDAQFIQLLKDKPGEYSVDIAHYSPPCQPFSSANHNKNVDKDFTNQKALFSVQDLTELLKPRIATIEETAGLMHRHQQWFDTLINIFSSLSYSIRWKIVRCQDHGIPQTRVRLLLMAAA